MTTTADDFRRKYHALDATAVTMLAEVYLQVRDIPGARGEIAAALTRLEDQAVLANYGARRSDPPPVAASLAPVR